MFMMIRNMKLQLVKWIITNQANSINVRKYKAVWGEDGLETTVLGLTFVVQENHLSSQGKLTLRCVSSVGPASASVVPPPQTQTQPEQPALQHVNDQPAASTASLAGYDQNYEPHLLSPVMESMEVRFEGIISFLFVLNHSLRMNTTVK